MLGQARRHQCPPGDQRPTAPLLQGPPRVPYFPAPNLYVSSYFFWLCVCLTLYVGTGPTNPVSICKLEFLPLPQPSLHSTHIDPLYTPLLFARHSFAPPPSPLSPFLSNNGSAVDDSKSGFNGPTATECDLILTSPCLGRTSCLSPTSMTCPSSGNLRCTRLGVCVYVCACVCVCVCACFFAVLARALYACTSWRLNEGWKPLLSASPDHTASPP
jgi:hypothetical protein